MAEGLPGLTGSALLISPSRALLLMPVSMEDVAGEGLGSTVDRGPDWLDKLLLVEMVAEIGAVCCLL